MQISFAYCLYLSDNLKEVYSFEISFSTLSSSVFGRVAFKIFPSLTATAKYSFPSL
jgi:hypothetical protein